MMKKRYALLMTAALMAAAPLTVTATQTDQMTQANIQQQMPQDPGQMPQMGMDQMPQMGMNQAPQMGMNQMPQMNQNGTYGKGYGRFENGKGHSRKGNHGTDMFKNLLDNGTIDEDTYNAIIEYLSQKQKSELIEDLLENGVITQEQANAISAAQQTPDDAQAPENVQAPDDVQAPENVQAPDSAQAPATSQSTAPTQDTMPSAGSMTQPGNAPVPGSNGL